VAERDRRAVDAQQIGKCLGLHHGCVEPEPRGGAADGEKLGQASGRDQ
jgi:hypothetical protein